MLRIETIPTAILAPSENASWPINQFEGYTLFHLSFLDLFFPILSLSQLTMGLFFFSFFSFNLFFLFFQVD